jgi:hypothetical protein
MVNLDIPPLNLMKLNWRLFLDSSFIQTCMNDESKKKLKMDVNILKTWMDDKKKKSRTTK